jgi:hypothetical protein
MPWAAIPFEGDKREELSLKYGVKVIPHVIILRGASP